MKTFITLILLSIVGLALTAVGVWYFAFPAVYIEHIIGTQLLLFVIVSGWGFLHALTGTCYKD